MAQNYLKHPSPSPLQQSNPNLFFSFDNRSPNKTPTPSPRKPSTPINTPNHHTTLITHNHIRPRNYTLQSMSPKPRKYSDASQQCEVNSVGGSVGPSNGSTVYDQAASRYECIASLTEQENSNLKEQNTYLLEKLRKMQNRQDKMKKLYEKAKKYKVLWQQAQIQISQLKEECEVYKWQAEEMKNIILNDVHRLKQKVLETQMETQYDNILPQTQQQSKSRVISQTSTAHKSAKQTKSQNSESSLSKYLKPDQNI